MRKSARIGIAERKSNFGDIHFRAGQQLAGHFKARFVDQIAEAPALRLQSSVQRPGLHGQFACDRFQRGIRKNDAGASMRDTVSVMLGCSTAQ